VQLVTAVNEDGLELDAALYEVPRSVAAVVHVHGKGGNFYSGPGRFIPEMTADVPISHLATGNIARR